MLSAAHLLGWGGIVDVLSVKVDWGHGDARHAWHCGVQAGLSCCILCFRLRGYDGCRRAEGTATPSSAAARHLRGNNREEHRDGAENADFRIVQGNLSITGDPAVLHAQEASPNVHGSCVALHARVFHTAQSCTTKPLPRRRVPVEWTWLSEKRMLTQRPAHRLIITPLLQRA